MHKCKNNDRRGLKQLNFPISFETTVRYERSRKFGVSGNEARRKKRHSDGTCVPGPFFPALYRTVANARAIPSAKFI